MITNYLATSFVIIYRCRIHVPLQNTCTVAEYSFIIYQRKVDRFLLLLFITNVHLICNCSSLL